MEIQSERVDQPDVIALLQSHHQDMLRHSPPQSVHALQLDELRRPEISFWTVREQGQLLGIGALKMLNKEQAEIKSMRTHDEHRRRGVAGRLLAHLETQACLQGVRQLLLETGTGEAFAPARGLYKRVGFIDCGPFAAYQPDPYSCFMSKQVV